MAGWLRTYLILFASAHIAIILFNFLHGPLDLLGGEQLSTERQVELGTGFYGVLMGLLTFGWVIIWLVVFFLMRDRAKLAEKRRSREKSDTA